MFTVCPVEAHTHKINHHFVECQEHRGGLNDVVGISNAQQVRKVAQRSRRIVVVHLNVACSRVHLHASDAYN